MFKNKKWFSLIEIVIATSIISISVFWVYKLIWENTKIINNSSIYLQVNSLFPIFQECIENKITNFNLSNWTSTWIYINNNLIWCQVINSWTIIDNITYFLSWTIIDSSDNYNKWILSISTDQTKTQTWEYLQIKK